MAAKTEGVGKGGLDVSLLGGVESEIEVIIYSFVIVSFLYFEFVSERVRFTHSHIYSQTDCHSHIVTQSVTAAQTTTTTKKNKNTNKKKKTQ